MTHQVAIEAAHSSQAQVIGSIGDWLASGIVNLSGLALRHQGNEMRRAVQIVAPSLKGGTKRCEQVRIGLKGTLAAGAALLFMQPAINVRAKTIKLHYNQCLLVQGYLR
jgi:hypothetical protein